MKKVRPMIDKDLRDEIVKYCGGDDSFNSSLRQCVANHRWMLITIKHLKQEIAKLHNEKAELKYLYTARSKEAESLNEKIANGIIGKLNSKRDVMYKGAFLGLIIGAAIGHVFL